MQPVLARVDRAAGHVVLRTVVYYRVERRARQHHQAAPPHTTCLRTMWHCLAHSYSCKFTLLDSKGSPTKTVRVSADVAADTERTLACVTPAWSPAGSGKCCFCAPHHAVPSSAPLLPGLEGLGPALFLQRLFAVRSALVMTRHHATVLFYPRRGRPRPATHGQVEICVCRLRERP